MWIPQIYRVDEVPVLQGFMKHHNFATLVSADGARLHSTEIPFVLKPENGKYGTLIGHIAKANPQSRTLATGRKVTVIFHGPHAYMSPNWYKDRETAVPTWNHATVCAHGIPQIIQDPDAVLEALRALVNQHEAQFEKPWTPEEAPAYVNKLLSLVVAFEIPIADIEGQFKLSQDRPTDLPAMIDILERSADSGERNLAKMMQDMRNFQLKESAKS